jgi:DMSO/TMAO reductase YedYZ molybdopterin-dependent catalytic subunit
MTSEQRTRDRKGGALAAAAGIGATVLGMAVGQLVASLTDPSSGPVYAVSSTVIDLTPTPLKEWAIAHFGSNDKTVLLSSVVVVTLLLAGLAGVVARRSLRAGSAILLLLVVLAGAAALTRPEAGLGDAIPALATAITGVAALAWLTERMSPTEAIADDPEAPERGASRRGVLLGLGASVALAAVAGVGGRLITSARTAVENLNLPKALRPLSPLPRGLEQKVDGISPFQTPLPDFYRVDTRVTLPVVSSSDWTLTIDGDVDHEVTLTLQDLFDMDVIERDITLTCVSNDVGGPYVGAARWLGVRLQDVLDKAGIDHTRADQILSTDVDGFTTSTPIDLALDGRDAMIAFGMNGEPLPREHGFPARMVVPGLYGFISACKWIERITLTNYTDAEAYWTTRGWATDAPIKVSSRIDTPKSFADIKSGDTFIGGVAWAQHHGIAKVEVQIDGAAWQEAKLGPSAGNDYWRQWYLPWNAESGEHNLAVRATTKDGEVQTTARAMPFPDGASGLQKIIVRVA